MDNDMQLSLLTKLMRYRVDQIAQKNARALGLKT